MHRKIHWIIPALSFSFFLQAQQTDIYYDKNYKLNTAGELYYNEAYRGAQYTINDLLNFGHLEPYQLELAEFYNSLISLIFNDEGAENKYKAFMGKYPQSVTLERGHLELGNYYLYNTEYLKALEEYSQVDIEQLPEYEQSGQYIKQGYAQLVTGDWERARQSLKKAEENPGKYKEEIKYLLDKVNTQEIEGIKSIEMISPLQKKYYENYIKGGFGSRNSWIADAFVSTLIKKNKIGIKISSIGSKGPENKYDWSTTSTNINTEGFYDLNLQSGKLHLAGNYTYRNANFYGLDIPELTASPTMDLKQEINRVMLKSYYDLYSNNYLDNISLQTGYWWDKFNTKESFTDIKAKLAKSSENASIMLSGLNFGVEADALFNYTYTKFETSAKKEYSYLTAGFSPVLKIFSQGSYLKIGGNLMYNGELKNNNTKIFVYPKAEFLFHAAKEIRVYTGIYGGLKLHNINEMSEENPYLYPDQNLRPTNTLYDIYAGVKGDVGGSFKYSALVSFRKAENLLFYSKTDREFNPLVFKPYNRLNTFDAVYDDGNIFNVKAALQYFWNGNLSFGMEGEYIHYDLEKLKEAYHMPKYRFSAEGGYKTLENKLKFGAKLYFTGDRKSNYYYLENGVIIEGIKALNNYFDLNLSAAYQLSDNFSVYVNGNNIFGRNYERYEGYQVLGPQIMGGFLVKF